MSKFGKWSIEKNFWSIVNRHQLTLIDLVNWKKSELSNRDIHTNVVINALMLMI